MADLIKRHNDKIEGAISCFDRVILTGTIEGLGYAQGMTNYFYANNIRIFYFEKWAQPGVVKIHRKWAEKPPKNSSHFCALPVC